MGIKLLFKISIRRKRGVEDLILEEAINAGIDFLDDCSKVFRLISEVKIVNVDDQESMLVRRDPGVISFIKTL